MELKEVVLGVLVLTSVSVSFFVSASAGLGGSLVLVPVLSLVLGSKEGVSLAALLLAGNNLVKLWAYRRALPVRSSALVMVCNVAGAFLGAKLFIAAPELLVSAAVALSLGVALMAERCEIRPWRGALPWVMSFTAGATSGFSGTSGPLKGVAIRSLAFDRMHTIGAAALVSAAADVTKTAVFAEAGLFRSLNLKFAIAAIPLMFVATIAGRHFAQFIGEKGYARLFWFVMVGYTLRLFLVR